LAIRRLAIQERMRFVPGFYRKEALNVSTNFSLLTLEYEGTPLSNRLAAFSSKFGTKRRQHELSQWGVFQLDPSHDLSLEEAEILALDVAQEMQNREAFACSKKFGYLSADFELQSVLAELPEANHTTPYS
jgi:hypothetical protein